MQPFIYRTFFSVSLVALTSLIFAQSGTTARILIRRNQNGVTTEESRIIQLDDGKSMNDVLREMGVMDQFGNLKPGQQFSINIEERDKSGQPLDQMQMLLNPFQSTSAMAYLGISMVSEEVQQGRKNIEGVMVKEVMPNSPAFNAGFMVGDMLLEIDGNKVSDPSEVSAYVQSRKPGDEVKVKILRLGRKKTLKAVLSSKQTQGMPNVFYPQLPEGYQFNPTPDSLMIFTPEDSAMISQPFSWQKDGMCCKKQAYLGVTPSEDQENLDGVRINVLPGTAAFAMGLADGDIVLSINDTAVKSFDDLAEIIRHHAGGDDVTIAVLREGKVREIKGQLDTKMSMGNDDFMIFHDFKGIDENGNYNYNYEFNMDNEDLMNQFRDLQNRYQRGIPNQNVEIKIDILDITTEEAAKVNEEASPKLMTDNALKLDRIVFFPNPNDGVINLEFSTADLAPIQIIVYNASGNKIYLESLERFSGNYKNTIDISEQPSGAYYLQLLQNGKAYSKKIVKE
jgi:PDZ domain-containing secreted protein